jgi:gliding motility-associated lipoprotein GldH
MSKIFSLWIPVLIGCAFLTSCGSKTYYNAEEEIGNGNTWSREKIKFFNVEVNDTSLRYDILASFAHAPEYQQSRLKIKILEVAPDSSQKAWSSEVGTLDDKGQRTSKSDGDNFRAEAVVKGEHRYTQTGTYRYEIMHEMPVDPLPGVISIGLAIRKAVAGAVVAPTGYPEPQFRPSPNQIPDSLTGPGTGGGRNTTPGNTEADGTASPAPGVPGSGNGSGMGPGSGSGQGSVQGNGKNGGATNATQTPAGKSGK